MLRGAPKIFPLTNLVFWTNRLDPPPSLEVGTPTTKIFFWCLFCILGYSKHFIFSWKFSFFWLGLVGIEVYWGPITSWIDEISPPIYVLCVSSHFWPFTKVNFVLTILQKSWDSVRPPPWLGQNPKFVKGNKLGAPLTSLFYLFSEIKTSLDREDRLIICNSPWLVFLQHINHSHYLLCWKLF